jgi:hypothetical protein
MLSVISINEAKKWDEIVLSFKNYDVNYLSDYAKAFQLIGSGEPLLFYYDDGSTRAINVIMKRDIADNEFFKNQIPQNTWFDFSTPYGYGGFWIDGKNYEGINKSYENYCNEQGIICEFVRFHLLSDYQQHYNGTSETRTHNVIRSLDLSLDDMLMDFEHKVRKNIKKANKSGLEVKIDYTGERLDDFLDIYYSTMERTGATEDYFFSREFFQVLNEMEGNYVYIHVLSEGKVISTELVLYGSENCYSFLGGTNRDYFHLRPNDLLKFEIIKWAKAKGLKRFILGGGYGDDDGIFQYKKSLAPTGIYDFYIGKKVFNIDKYNKLLSIRESEAAYTANTKYFPAYRG